MPQVVSGYFCVLRRHPAGSHDRRMAYHGPANEGLWHDRNNGMPGSNCAVTAAQIPRKTRAQLTSD